MTIPTFRRRTIASRCSLVIDPMIIEDPNRSYRLSSEALLPRPAGFKGFGEVGIEADLRHFAAGQLEEEPPVLLYTNSAGSPFRYLENPNQDRPTQTDDLLRKALPLAEVLCPQSAAASRNPALPWKVAPSG